MRDVEGLGPTLGQQPPDLGAAAGGQQRHALGGAEAVVEGLHPRIDPLAPMLPRLLEPLPIQLTRVDAEDLAAQPVDRLDLDSPRAAQPAGGLDRAHIPLERLGPGELLQVLDTVLGGPYFQRVQQGPGGQLGARIGAQGAARSAARRWLGRGPGTWPAPARRGLASLSRPAAAAGPRTAPVTHRGRRSTLRGLRAICSSQ